MVQDIVLPSVLVHSKYWGGYGNFSRAIRDKSIHANLCIYDVILSLFRWGIAVIPISHSIAPQLPRISYVRRYRPSILFQAVFTPSVTLADDETG